MKDCCLQVWNTKQGRVMHETSYSSRVLAVRVNEKYLLVCLEQDIIVYRIDSLKPVAKLRTSKNPRGVVAMTTNEPYLIAFPTRSDRGDFTIYDLESFDYINEYAEHESPIKHLQFDHTSSKIASVSLSVCNPLVSNNIPTLHIIHRGDISKFIIYSQTTHPLF